MRVKLKISLYYPHVNHKLTLKIALAYLDLHVTELADHAEAAPLLPQVANNLIAHGSLTMSERAVVSLKNSKIHKY